MEHLAKHAPLTCLCSRNNQPSPASFAIDNSLPVSKTQFLQPLCWLKILRKAKRLRTTHLVLEFPYYGIAGFLCHLILPVKWIIHSHNIESIRFRLLNKRWWRLLYLFEKWTLRKADAVLFKTEKDRRYAIQHFGLNAKKTFVVPYGVLPQPVVDKRAARVLICERHKIPISTNLLLFAGTLDYAPNAEALTNLVQQVLPRLNQTVLTYKVLVCGRIERSSFAYLRSLQGEKLLYAGAVDDMETYFAAADVFVNPVATGGGVQTKSIDALNHHLNVVCFQQMTEGIHGANGKLFTAPDKNWNAFADAIVHALQNPQPTPPDFFSHHDWNNIAAKAFQFLQTI